MPTLWVATRGRTALPNYWDNCPDYCPLEVAFSIFLAADGRGWVSIEDVFLHAVVLEVEWRQTAHGIEVSSHEVRDELRSNLATELGWRDMVINVSDSDGDGTAESGTASLTIVYSYEISLSLYEEEFTTSLDLSKDGTAPALGLASVDSWRSVLILGERILAHATKPLLREMHEDQVSLLVNGQPHAATVAATGLRGPFATGLVITPSLPLPFGASISVDPGAAGDATGNSAIFDGRVIETFPDPGPLTDNPGFEGDGGWVDLSAVDSMHSFSPVEGQRFAHVGDLDDLVGYLDVPPDATTLRFWAGINEYLDGCAWTREDLHERRRTNRVSPQRCANDLL